VKGYARKWRLLREGGLVRGRRDSSRRLVLARCLMVHTLDYCCLSCLDEAVALSLEDAEMAYVDPWYS